MKYGIEIEFVAYNYYELFNILNKYDCVITFDSKYTNRNKLILKPESTVKGCELNIPPGFDKLKELCNDLQPLVYFNERCAMHIHIDGTYMKQEDLDKLEKYYIRKESSIIKEADYRYVDLNFSNSDKHIGRKRNLNTYSSYMLHRTIEHRIYKGTFVYDDIMFAVNQSIKIIEEALNL